MTWIQRGEDIHYVRYNHVGDVAYVYEINVRSTVFLTLDAVEIGGEVDLASDVATGGDNVGPAGRCIEPAAVVCVAGIGDVVTVEVGVRHAVAAIAVDSRSLAESAGVERQPSVER